MQKVTGQGHMRSKIDLEAWWRRYGGLAEEIWRPGGGDLEVWWRRHSQASWVE